MCHPIATTTVGTHLVNILGGISRLYNRNGTLPFVLGSPVTYSRPGQIAELAYSIPYCVKFEQRDIEDPWTGVEEDSFDLIHARMLLGSVANWYAMYEKILRYVTCLLRRSCGLVSLLPPPGLLGLCPLMSLLPKASETWYGCLRTCRT